MLRIDTICHFCLSVNCDVCSFNYMKSKVSKRLRICNDVVLCAHILCGSLQFQHKGNQLKQSEW